MCCPLIPVTKRRRNTKVRKQAQMEVEEVQRELQKELQKDMQVHKEVQKQVQRDLHKEVQRQVKERDPLIPAVAPAGGEREGPAALARPATCSGQPLSSSPWGWASGAAPQPSLLWRAAPRPARTALASVKGQWAGCRTAPGPPDLAERTDIPECGGSNMAHQAALHWTGGPQRRWAVPMVI